MLECQAGSIGKIFWLINCTFLCCIILFIILYSPLFHKNSLIRKFCKWYSYCRGGGININLLCYVYLTSGPEGSINWPPLKKFQINISVMPLMKGFKKYFIKIYKCHVIKMVRHGHRVTLVLILESSKTIVSPWIFVVKKTILALLILITYHIN